MTRTVTCPHCGKDAVYSEENPHRPFCSKRCKMIDLGTWADEGYRVPSQSDDSWSEVPDGENNLNHDEQSSKNLH